MNKTNNCCDKLLINVTIEKKCLICSTQKFFKVLLKSNLYFSFICIAVVEPQWKGESKTIPESCFCCAMFSLSSSCDTSEIIPYTEFDATVASLLAPVIQCMFGCYVPLTCKSMIKNINQNIQ